MTNFRRDTKSWRNDVEQLLEIYTAAWSFEGSPDWSKIEALYAPDADIVFYDAFVSDPLIGRAAMIVNAQALFANIATLTVSSAGHCALRALGERLVITATKITFLAHMTKGDVTNLTMRLSLAWERRNDHWVIVHEHVSSALRLYEAGD